MIKILDKMLVIARIGQKLERRIVTLVATIEPLADRRIPKGGDWLSASEIDALRSGRLADRTRALTPLLAANALEAEQLRRPVDAVWSEIRRSGFFYQFVPERFGGLQSSMEQFLDAALPLAEGCSSTSWNAAFCAVHNWYLAQFPLEAQEEVWGSFPYIVAPDVTFPPGKAVRQGAGYRVSGRWKWGTGVMHADWIFAKAMVDTPDGPQMAHVLFPASEGQVIDTWHVDGMAGTGSNDVAVKDLFIPEHRLTLLAPSRSGRGLGAELYPGSVYATPAMAVLAVTAAIPALGTARTAVRLLRERLMVHVSIGTAVAQRERPASQMRLARADIMVRTAETLLRSAAREGLTFATIDEPEQTEHRIRLRTQVAYAVGLCRSAVSILCDAAGSSLHFLSNPLQRCKRDIEVMSSHIVYDLDIATEEHGRVMLGLPPSNTLS